PATPPPPPPPTPPTPPPPTPPTPPTPPPPPTPTPPTPTPTPTPTPEKHIEPGKPNASSTTSLPHPTESPMPNPTTFTTTLRWLLNRIEDDRLPAPTHATGWADGHWNLSVATETDLTQWAAYLNATPSVMVSKHGDS